MANIITMQQPTADDTDVMMQCACGICKSVTVGASAYEKFKKFNVHISFPTSFHHDYRVDAQFLSSIIFLAHLLRPAAFLRP